MTNNRSVWVVHVRNSVYKEKMTERQNKVDYEINTDGVKCVLNEAWQTSMEQRTV